MAAFGELTASVGGPRGWLTLSPPFWATTDLAEFAGVESSFELGIQGLKHLHPIPTSATGDAPAESVLAFHAAFAECGDKRKFLQFQAGGRIHRVAFTVFTT